ncbi:tyrosine protein kinase [Saccharomycopsis crataegensis]|uniref:Tyrosine protein kinase n=1 Tax=Saccharomycopsis crataegensis TaxID=43959 RepID=A0AAV5QJU2_9ASCO|nr:tyrosine protein kinase [Saccharomycopsis crataegensis]
MSFSENGLGRSGLKRSTALFNLSINNDALLSSTKSHSGVRNDSKNENNPGSFDIKTKTDTQTLPQRKINGKRTYSISPNIANCNKLFKFSHSQFRRVRNNAYNDNNNIEIDVENWSPFKDDNDDETNVSDSTPSRSTTNSLFSTMRKVPSSSLQSNNTIKSTASIFSNLKEPSKSTMKLVGGVNNELPKESEFKFTFKNSQSTSDIKTRGIKGSSKGQNAKDAPQIFSLRNMETGNLSGNNKNNSSIQRLNNRSNKNKHLSHSYRLVKPFQAAFSSSGLMSKKNNFTSSTPLKMPDSPFIQNKNSQLFFANNEHGANALDSRNILNNQGGLTFSKPVPDTPCKNAVNNSFSSSKLMMTVEKPRSRLSTYVSYSDENVNDIFNNRNVLNSVKKSEAGDHNDSDMMMLDSPNFDKKSLELNFSPASSKIPSPNFNLKKSSRFLKFSSNSSFSPDSRNLGNGKYSSATSNSPSSVEKILSPSNTPSSKKIKDKLKSVSSRPSLAPLSDIPLNLNKLGDDNLFNSKVNASDDSINNSRNGYFNGKKRDQGGNEKINDDRSNFNSPNNMLCNLTADHSVNMMNSSPTTNWLSNSPSIKNNTYLTNQNGSTSSLVRSPNFKSINTLADSISPKVNMKTSQNFYGKNKDVKLNEDLDYEDEMINSETDNYYTETPTKASFSKYHNLSLHNTDESENDSTLKHQAASNNISFFNRSRKVPSNKENINPSRFPSYENKANSFRGICSTDDIVTPVDTVQRSFPFTEARANTSVLKTPNSSSINLNEDINTVTPTGRFYEDIIASNETQSKPSPDILIADAQAPNQTRLGATDDFLVSKLGSNIRLSGEGEFSLVFECDYKNYKYAIKRSKRPVKLSKRAARYQSDGEYALRFENTADKEFILGLVGYDVSLVNCNPDEEISILNNLKKNARKFTGSEYLINYVSNFSINSYNYIVTEFCEEGSLDKFLLKNSDQKLDEFRVWKIVTEVLFGLNFLHENGILHLDLKPANIFINFEGSLKIGDFGLSTKMEDITNKQYVEKKRDSKIFSSDGEINSNEDQQGKKREKDSGVSMEKEGDREYIAPEILLKSEYSSAADIFSLGLIIVEIAANIYLPDNGVSWQKLRSGDLSDAGRLSFRDLAIHDTKPSHQHTASTSVNSNYTSTASTATTSRTNINSSLSKNYSSLTSDSGSNLFNYENSMINTISHAVAASQPNMPTVNSLLSNHSNVSNASRTTFLRDGNTLDLMVHWMIEPNPKNRPSATELINLYELQYIELKRKAGAIIYEGEYGPQLNLDDVMGTDEEDDYAFNRSDSYEYVDNLSNLTLVKKDSTAGASNGGCTMREYLDGFPHVLDRYSMGKFNVQDKEGTGEEEFPHRNMNYR